MARDYNSEMIFLYGSSRANKIAQALENHFSVIQHEDITGSIRFSHPILSKLENLYLVIVTLIYTRPIVLVDSVGYQHLTVGLCCKVLGLPFIVRLRGGMQNEFFDRAHKRAFISRFLFAYKSVFFRNRVLDLADHIITVSHSNRQQVIKELDLPPDDISVVYLPAPTMAFDETPLGRFRSHLEIEPGADLLLTATNFNYQDKYWGLVDYAPVIADLLRQYDSWYFVIAGGGDSFEEGRTKICQKFDEMTRDRVIFTGYYEEIEEAFVDCDVYAHLSYRDSMGMTVLEAEAAGKPVVVNDAGGLPELVEGCSEEVRQVVRDAGELHGSLETLFTNPSIRASIGEDGRKRIESEFTVEGIAQDFRDAIENGL